MIPSQQAREAGLKSLLEVSEITGVSIQTLSNWAKSKPDLFKIVILGAAEASRIAEDLTKQDA